MTGYLRSLMRKVISDAYYDARNTGQTMEAAADAAADGVVDLLERAADVTAEGLVGLILEHAEAAAAIDQAPGAEQRRADACLLLPGCDDRSHQIECNEAWYAPAVRP